MIAHDVTRIFPGRASFKPLAAYILRVPEFKGDPLTWGLGQDRQTEAVAWAKAVNSASSDLGWAIKETDLVQRMNKRANSNKNYHYVISFPAGEQPSREILENIEQVLSTAIGYGAHQRLMAVHRDTDNLHMHVAVNRVHPKTFNVIGTAYDHLTLQRMSAVLEDIHGLIKNNHAPGTRTQPRRAFVPSWQAEQPEREAPSQSFKDARDQAAQARKQALDALREKHQKYARDLVAWHKQRRANAGRQKLSRADRKSTNLYLREAAQNDHEARKQKEKWERDAVKLQFPVLTLEAFKRQQAEHAAALERFQYQATRDLRSPSRTR